MFKTIINTFLILIALSTVSSEKHQQTSSKFNITSDLDLLRRIKGADIKSWMNLKIDPCKNFYDYTCGNWKRIYATQAHKEGSISRYGVLSSEMERRAREFISNLNHTNVIEGKMLDFYESCRHTNKSPEDYKMALQKLSSEFGGFSFQKTTEEEKQNNNTIPFNWWTTVANIYRKFGINIIIDVSTGYHFKSRNRNMIFMDQGITLLSEEDIHDMKKYFLKYFGANIEDVDDLIEDMYKFNDKLSDAIDAYTADFAVEQFVLHNVSDIQNRYKDLFDLDTFLKIAFELNELPSEIYVEKCKYFNDLIKILNDTKPETVQNYIVWLIMKEFNVVVPFSEDIDSVCKDKTKYYFAQYLENALYKQFRSQEFEKALYDLWYELTQVFREDLQSPTSYPWMSEKTRREAIKKLDNMRLSINSFNNVNFEKFFRDLQINPQNYVQSLRNIMELFEIWRGRHLQIRTAGIDVINHDTFTPVYDSELNKVDIPVATFLPFRLWHPAYPKFILYSDLGSTLAHELIHAFDDSNRQFDSEGNANMWWDDNSIKEYNEQRHCFQAQYHRYILAGQQVRNMTDQSENISDNAAIRISFDAYKKWLTKMTANGINVNSSELLQNLPYNSEELFFITYGQSYCEAIDKETLLDVMEDETHAPDILRVLVPLGNYPKFAEVFKCAPNSFMNPKKKCTLY